MSNRCFISFILAISLIYASLIQASTPHLPETNGPTTSILNKPLMTPSPPTINAKAFILIDVASGRVIAEKNSDEKLAPASLTKMMTLYVLSNALHHQQVQLKDNVRISRNAWKVDGSRMFVKEGQEVSIDDLLKGIIVDSGNDACIAIAEHLGGSEQGFSDIMNQQAQALGMHASHFTDSTGLPDENHYTTAKDLAILGRALVRDFPEYYDYYKQKRFEFNGIRQLNRNRLLWRNSYVDGIKTGHTNEAGFCLVSSALHDNMRLLAVVLGSPSDAARADDSERLLNYGFRFFQTHEIYKANQAITEINVYKGASDKLAVGVATPLFITIPSGQYQRLSIKTKVLQNLEAPIQKGDNMGELMIEFDHNVMETYPLYALNSVESGGFFVRATDTVRLAMKRWFNS